MGMKEFRTAAMLTMLVLLVTSAPEWMQRADQPSSYEAPWIYPGNMPR